MRPELFALLPCDKSDTAKAEAVIAAGYPAVEPLLPRLIEWVQDMNWPVAVVLAPFLAGIGRPMEDHVRQVLMTTDEVWKYWVLECIVGKSAELLECLRPELERIASSPTEGEAGEEIHLLAQSLLRGAK
ncbi:DUF5071 domain-containing protein [Ahniella affigens]|uniref:DUF5071 domain-containing protein n=1 Tax=Ahniella affigens TaxID=2021234 RepID=A0A2P1PPN8_9GAMM|nr:DUF5071 domain-containing protein [Ahniella affigens]